MTRRPGIVLRAAAVAAVLSGVPSTAWTLIDGGDLLASTRAAGQMLLPGAGNGRRALMAGALVHSALSVGWSAVLVAVLPRRRTVAAGAVAGLGIAAVDLAIARARFPAVAALPTAPQVADHVAFGVLTALVRRAADRRASRTINNTLSDNY